MEIKVLPFSKRGFNVETLKERNRLHFNKEVLNAIAQNPLVDIPIQSFLEEVSIDDIKTYLQSKHSSLWGNFSVLSEEGMAKAAKWFKGEIDSLIEFLSDSESRVPSA